MLKEITENIEKLVVRFPGGMREVNCYLIKGAKGYTIIDTGTYSKESIDTWKAVLKSGITIEKVVLTHTHQDHIGLAKWFQEQIGVPIFTSKLGYKEMLKGRDFIGRKEKLSHLIKGHGGPGLPDKLEDDSFIYDFEPDGFFEENEMIQLGNDFYEVIWIPGHAPDQYGFYHSDNKVMIIGDHVLKDISPVIGLWTGEELNPLKEYFGSLAVMKNFPATITLPGHGEIISDLDLRVQDIMDRHYYRLEQILEHLADRQMTAKELCEDVYSKLNIYIYLSSFMATLTRLIYLESIGKIHRKTENGIVYFKK
ncbi:MBL fold metallo-hydrolase [Oceanobacillus massiliensis]|uniref:MBL fold metallo-hydrolase n=1 Tax=Oceanobacillus massiliensis TaxID=1465765 RepID=UPI000289CA80|nr:MBL fold metallo-hydrolase [Oceanobacillus massiliensis]